ncbi:hypothetical protein MXZ36_09875 [Streptococcus uberis]|nr:hypothetical protein [Streptococcus uberis]
MILQKLLFNQTDLENLQSAVNNQSATISTKVEQSDLLITNKNVTTAQATANQAKTDAQAAMTKATEAQANSLPLMALRLVQVNWQHLENLE